MKDDKIVLYAHAGSDNHGCEAIANTLCRLLPKPAILMTNRAAQDEKYSLKDLPVSLEEERRIDKNVLVHSWYYAWRAIFRDPECFMRYRYRNISGKNLRALNISIGGDNYCYDNMLDRLILANRMFTKQGAKTMLVGCSIEPERLQNPEILEDMKRYNAISARESITFEALKAAGITDNVYLYPDSAFLLESQYLPLPKGWVEGKMLGINVSPMIVDNEAQSGVTMENYKALIRYVLENTELHVALIPHVVWAGGDDRKTLGELYEFFKDTDRVLLIPDASASQLKGYISRCRLFVGARTHATIAAYSTCVPTLTVGYSVKARGIAKDLFGTEEHYVLPVQQLKRQDDLTNAFIWLMQNEEQIRKRLTQIMPDYQKRAGQVAELIERLADNKQ